MVYKSQAPGKLIIAGEHAVVYGYPALAAAVSLRSLVQLRPRKDRKQIFKSNIHDTKLLKLTVDTTFQFLKKTPTSGFSLVVKSDIPEGSGMGSSASIAAASTLTLLQFLKTKPDKEFLNKIVYEIEKEVHGTPSGLDNTTVVYGGVLAFKKKGENFRFNQLKSTSAVLAKFILVQSGKPRESTADMITNVALNVSENFHILKEIGRITSLFIQNTKRGVFEPELIRENQRLLEKLGVVGERAKSIVHSIEEIGGVAKVCGAGGIKKGSGILLTYHPQIEKIKTLAQKNKWNYFSVKLGVKGAQ